MTTGGVTSHGLHHDLQGNHHTHTTHGPTHGTTHLSHGHHVVNQMPPAMPPTPMPMGTHQHHGLAHQMGGPQSPPPPEPAPNVPPAQLPQVPSHVPTQNGSGPQVPIFGIFFWWRIQRWWYCIHVFFVFFWICKRWVSFSFCDFYLENWGVAKTAPARSVFVAICSVRKHLVTRFCRVHKKGFNFCSDTHFGLCLFFGWFSWVSQSVCRGRKASARKAGVRSKQTSPHFSELQILRKEQFFKGSLLILTFHFWILSLVLKKNQRKLMFFCANHHSIFPDMFKNRGKAWIPNFRGVGESFYLPTLRKLGENYSKLTASLTTTCCFFLKKMWWEKTLTLISLEVLCHLFL